VPVIGDAMTVYHQSEWSRTPSTVLPIVENKADVNRDIGLMEFFTAPNEAGAPQAIETDADQDIGLMEFKRQAPVGLR
jgi:hypothetical protein